MSKAEDYITQNTKTLEEYGKKYFKWLTPDQARSAVEIAKEEVIEWIDKHWREYIDVDANGFLCFGHWKNDLRKAMKDE